MAKNDPFFANFRLKLAKMGFFWKKAKKVQKRGVCFGNPSKTHFWHFGDFI